MTEAHHNRLVLAVEIAPPARATLNRVLDRAGSERLLGCIAADLAAVAPGIAGTRLAGAGCLLEPSELLRPGLPAWAALDELTQRARGGQPFSPELFSLGAARGRMPDDRLMPRHGPPAGLLLGMPLTAYTDGPDPALREILESALFERGGSRPPVHAELAGQCGDGIVHAHAFTLADLLAMYRVQLEQAGLETPARVLQAVISGDETVFPLTDDAGLEIDLADDEACINLRYVTPAAWSSTGRRTPEDYILWLQAYRILTTLAGDHGIGIHIVTDLPRHPDCDRVLVETLGNDYGLPRRVRHQSPDLGITGWSVVEPGRRTNYWPLDTAGARWLKDYLENTDTPCPGRNARLCYDIYGLLNFALDEKEKES